MIIDVNFDKRKEDVDAHFRCLAFIDNVATYKNMPIVDKSSGAELYVDQQMQCCMKAQTLVILYNLVESTVCDCLNYIYDSVADDGLTYADLTDEMRNMWTASCRRASRAEQNWTETAKMPVLAVFDEIALNTSGSIDIRKIYEAFGKHGCSIAEEKREECGNSFLTVKIKRNPNNGFLFLLFHCFTSQISWLFFISTWRIRKFFFHHIPKISIMFLCKYC